MADLYKSVIKMEGIVYEKLFDNKGNFDLSRIIPEPKDVNDDWWRLNNWGTNRNTQETEIINNDTIRIVTDWGIPDKIFEAFMERYAEEKDIEILFAHESSGENTGRYYAEDGYWSSVTYDDDTEEAYETFEECWN